MAWDGTGWPQTVGEPGRPARVQVKAHRYEVILVLPPQAPDDFAGALGSKLQVAAENDRTLGGRVRNASVPDDSFEPEEVESQDFGEGSKRITVPVTIYGREIAGSDDDPKQASGERPNEGSTTES